MTFRSSRMNALADESRVVSEASTGAKVDGPGPDPSADDPARESSGCWCAEVAAMSENEVDAEG
jgi:hypothetical protein